MVDRWNIINLNTVDRNKWSKDPNNIYVGRPSKWGNPHQLHPSNNREVVVHQFEKYLLRNEYLLDSISELKGKVLGCWCSPLLCHAEILHRFAGNKPLYQPASTKSQTMDSSSLDQQVTDALEAMNEVLNHIGQDLSSTPLRQPPMENTTPLLSVSTVETNKMYETLLVTNSSCSSTYKDLSSSEASLSPQLIKDQLLKERSDLDCKLELWRTKNTRSCHSACSSPVRRTAIERRTKSAPTSPVHQTSIDNITLLNPPDPFSLHSSTTQDSIVQKNTNTEDATSKILDFLAHKVDLLAVTVNTLQYNVSKITESLGVSLNDKIPDSLQKMEQAFHDKFDYLQGKFDNYTKILDKELNSARLENVQLKEQLEKYIAEESLRVENFKECITTAPNLPCITDIQPLKAYLDEKMLELDVRLVECEQYSRRESLIISGIPKSVTQQQLESKVIEILGLIGLRLIPDDITACHRLFNPPGSEFPAKVIVRFYNRKVVNFCLDHKDELQDRAYQHLRLNLRFFESLCSKNEESLRICKGLKGENKIHDYFLRNGFIKIVREENGRPCKIAHPDILRQEFVDSIAVNGVS